MASTTPINTPDRPTVAVNLAPRAGVAYFQVVDQEVVVLSDDSDDDDVFELPQHPWMLQRQSGVPYGPPATVVPGGAAAAALTDAEAGEIIMSFKNESGVETVHFI